MTASPQEFERLHEYLEFYARETPDALACVFEEQRWTYRELYCRVQACALALRQAGIKAGDRVAVLSTPRVEFWCLFLASLRVGAIWLGLNPRYRYAELAYVIADSRPKLIFSIAEFEGRDFRSDAQRLGTLYPSAHLPVGIGASLEGGSFEEFLVAGERSNCALPDLPSGEDPALIVYTSGSTGSPKGAVLSQYGLAKGAAMQTRHLAMMAPSLVVNFPINHVACVADTCATTLVAGGKIVFRERFDALDTLKTVEQEGCTMLGGVPTMLQLMLEQPELPSIDLSSVQLIAWGGAAMPAVSIERLGAICQRRLSLYGLTETAANIVFVNQEAGVEELASAIGWPDEHVRVRVVDEEGALCADGVPGELQFQGDFFFLGYWERPEATTDAWTEDGWFRSGDIGSRDAAGCLSLRGRKSDMFKSGGYNIYPREIEAVLEALPEVAMAAVIGVPHTLYQEVGHAWVLPAAGKHLAPEKLTQQCREHLANYKVPKRISIVDGLPMLPVGKVDKSALREWASKEEACSDNKH